MSETDERDAARWRALMKCERIRVLGSAGFGTEGAHIGLEFWAKHPNTEFSAKSVAWFIEFVDGLVETQAKETSHE